MKEVFKKAFSLKAMEPFLVGISIILLLEYVVYPGLTVANTVFNLLAGGLAVGILLFLYYYLRIKTPVCKKSEEIEAGETELDYVPIKEVKKKKTVKKKSVTKK
jgi:hypothetical protein